eukprot:GHVN01011400.1.p1 GENE.GHVN01011400.1~~GHVN01011400.1.p1  ORF type:complete len:444 (+),score=81.23 GHVN01011400.1:30-1361(+)
MSILFLIHLCQLPHSHSAMVDLLGHRFQSDQKERYFVHNITEGFLQSDSVLLSDAKVDDTTKRNHIINSIDSLIEVIEREQIQGASSYTGALGVVATNIHLFRVTKDSRHIERALSDLNKVRKSELKRDVSNWHIGMGGYYAMKAVAQHLVGDTTRAANASGTLLTHLRDSNQIAESNEILYGRAGLLECIMYVRGYLNDLSFGSEVAKEIVHSMLTEGSAKEGRLYYEWHGKEYLGAAHGYAGILYTLLHFPDAVAHYNKNALDVIRKTLDHIITSYIYQSHNVMSSTKSSNDDRLVHWCHGAPGYIPLLIKASEVWGNEQYRSVAAEMGEMVWQRGLLRKGIGLCHGISGNGYSFLSLYRSLKSPYWVWRARVFADFALAAISKGVVRKADHPLSLYEGTAGLVCYVADLLHPSTSHFVGYESPPLNEELCDSPKGSLEEL